MLWIETETKESLDKKLEEAQAGHLSLSCPLAWSYLWVQGGSTSMLQIENSSRHAEHIPLQMILSEIHL